VAGNHWNGKELYGKSPFLSQKREKERRKRKKEGRTTKLLNILQHEPMFSLLNLVIGFTNY